MLGSGGPESGRFVGFSVLPVTGFIEIDSEDIDTLVADGRMGDFVKQQFGHVVSLFTLCQALLQRYANPCAFFYSTVLVLCGNSTNCLGTIFVHTISTRKPVQSFKSLAVAQRYQCPWILKHVQVGRRIVCKLSC